MGNKTLRPNVEQPLSGFSDEQMSYLKNKFDFLCDESKLLSASKIQQAFRCSKEEASKILNYIDFENKGEVDFYQFTCAAASLHQNDDDARQFLYDLFGNGEQLNEQSFKSLFSAVVRYLKYYELHNEEYTPQLGVDKFKQYDYDGNGSLGFDEFKIILKNDFYCRKWMEALGFAQPNPEEPIQKPNNEENEFLVEQAEGDEAGSTPSWKKTIGYMAPDEKIDFSHLESPPTSKLQLEYVYGYRSYDTNDNLRYNSNGQIVYHTAACGIVLNKTKNTMKVNVDHNDDITCLDINLNKNLVVTGQLGRTPSLIVWDSNTLETKHVFKSKKLEHSISHVSISKSGRYVAATSMSDKHQVVIYDLSKKSMVAIGNGPRSVIHAIKFTNNQEELVCACQKEVVFVRFQTGKIQNKRGVFGKAPLAANYCVALAGDAIVTGMGNGVIGYWKGNVCSRVYKQHLKPVTAMGQRKQGGIISGDTTGVIILWSANLSKQRQINLQKLMNSNNPKIISLCQGYGNILVGTRGGEIVEVQQKSNSAVVVMEGHFDQQLWGLSVTGNKNEFITGGQDKLLIKWDSSKRKLVTKKKLQFSINSIDINRNGLIAVGHTNGIIAFYDCNKLDYIKKIQTFKNPDKEMISVVKFSPNGNTLAVGYCPPISQVFFYNVETANKIGQSSAKTSRIWSIDFTRDGSAVMINNTSYQILFYNANNGAQITSATQFKRQEFATMTSRFSWYTQGIWPPCSDGTDINSVDRSNSKKYLVTADDWSKIKLFKYPVCQNRQIYNVYRGHSSHVTGVKWMYDDRYVISIGGLEKSIIQWAFQDSQEIIYDYQEKAEQEQEKKQEDQEKYQEQLPDEPSKKEVEEGEFNVEQAEGDQALAVKPFLGQVKQSIPDSLRNKQIKNVAPEQDLIIKHVWGIRNQYINDRVRNQLRYSPSYTSCLFITATLGVEMNLKTMTQKFYQGHQQDLVSFAITRDRRYCATGQMAQLNKGSPKSKILDIHVWDSETKQNKVILKGFHQRAVVILEFSPSGKRLLSVGQDDKNSLAVYDWEVNRKAWSSPVCGAKVTGAAWKNENQYMTVGLKHVKYWNKQKGTMCKVPGKWDPMASVVFWNEMFVSGGSTGVLYLWSGSTAITTKGHEGRVDCLQVNKNILYSGCSKGMINKWKYSGGKLVLDQKILNMAEFDKFSPGILSLDFSDENMLICTNSSSIYQIPQKSKQNPVIIMQSHYENELWAESWSPDSSKFVTGGDDATVRIYDAKSFEMLYCYKMKQKVRGLDWQKSNGQLIVVGDLKGKIYLFDKELNLIDESKTRFSKTKPRKQPFWIEAIKFSPDGKYVALGTHGGTTYISIFQIADNKFGKQTTSKNLISSAALSIDWDKSSHYLAIISQAYQLQFTNLTERVSASSMRTTDWASWTGKFGAYVQQIHMDVDYSNINSVDISPDWKLVATANDDQKINLFQCPVIIGRQKHKQFVGHSSHVTKVRFSANQQYLLSTGGNDRTVILWKVYQQGQNEDDENEQNQEKQNGQKQQQNEQNEQNEGNQDADQISIPQEKTKQVEKTKPKASEDEEDGQFGLEQDEGDQFMAVKPWEGAIKPPTTKYYKGTGKEPKVQLIRQYAHGYRSKDCRNNLIYISQDTIAYHTAGLGVMMKTSQQPRSQSFFDKHSDDIISMCWNQDKSAIFTGQMGAKPPIYQWNVKGDLIQTYSGALKGVSALGVNQKYLAAAEMDDNHYVYLFDLKSGKKIGEEKGGREFITALKWIDAENFVTIGVKHFKVWTVSNKSIKGKSGIFNKNCNILCCLGVKDNNIYVGASNGHLQVWSGNTCAKSIQVHKKASINALTITENAILTGSKDSTICILDISTLQVLSRINCKQLLIDSVNSQIEALDVYENRIIIGTKGSQIFQIKSNKDINNTDQTSQFKLCGHYMSGHYSPNYVTNQVWGLSLYKNNYYLSSGDDGTLRVWDINKREQIACINLDLDQKLSPRKRPPNEKFLPNSCKGNSIAVAKTGEIVVGTKDGKIIVFNQSFSPLLVQKVRKSELRPEISVVKLSPDEKTLAVGDHEGRIALLNWNQGQSRMKVKSQSIKHSSAIKNLDFSRDSNIIHSTCTSYQLLFWDVNTGQQIKSGATMTRDQEWASWSLSLGWPVKGIFQEFMDGSDINAVDRSKNSYGNENMRLLAASDDRSHIRIFEYPCLEKNAKSVVGTGHSSHVTNVLFSSEDKRIFSTGGEDATVIQWILNTDQL